MNAFCISNTCNSTDLFHSSTSVYCLVSRNHFHHRAQRVLRAQHLMTSCPTPTANRGRHERSADYYRSNAPPRQPTEAAACAQRRLLYKPCPRRVPLRGMRSETKGSAPQRAAAGALGGRNLPPCRAPPGGRQRPAPRRGGSTRRRGRRTRRGGAYVEPKCNHARRGRTPLRRGSERHGRVCPHFDRCRGRTRGSETRICRRRGHARRSGRPTRRGGERHGRDFRCALPQNRREKKRTE